MNFQGFGTVTNEEITKFENTVSFILPKDYREFLETDNGGTFQGDSNSIFVDSAKEEVALRGNFSHQNHCFF